MPSKKQIFERRFGNRKVAYAATGNGAAMAVTATKQKKGKEDDKDFHKTRKN